MELKQDLNFAFVISPLTFNQTRMELKLENRKAGKAKPTFNQTRMELKRINVSFLLRLKTTFNQTRMELKLFLETLQRHQLLTF